MKLHLHLTMRRALLAAIALISQNAAQATSNSSSFELDISTPESLLGVQKEFLSSDATLQNLEDCDFTLVGQSNASIDWNNYTIIIPDNKKLYFRETDTGTGIQFYGLEYTNRDIRETYRAAEASVVGDGLLTAKVTGQLDSPYYEGTVTFAKGISVADNTPSHNITAKMLSLVRMSDYGYVEEKLGSTGIGLHLRNQVTLSGTHEHAMLGFESADDFPESMASSADTPALLESIEIDAGAQVTLQDMQVHATHALVVSGTERNKADLNLDNVEMHIGAQSSQNPLASYQNTVQTLHHVTDDSLIRHARLNLANGASLHFHNGVAIENSTLKGTGTIKNAQITGGQLIAGNSPGLLELDTATASQTEISFYLITNPTGQSWNFSGSNNNTAKLLSNYRITGTVTLNNVNFKALYQREDGTGYTDTTNAALNGLFQPGASITLLTGNLTGLSGSYTFDTSTLPELADGLSWDTSQLFTTGMIYVTGNMTVEELSEPVRIANTLVSAGETMLSFGRHAQKQAELRSKGTTRTWGSALSSFHSVSGNGARTGYDYNSWGGAVGADYAFSSHSLAGVAFGFNRGENKAKHGNAFYTGGKIEQEGTMLGLYGAHQFHSQGLLNKLRLDAFAAYGWFKNKSTRNSLRGTHTATGEWDSEAWVLSATLSRDIVTDSNWVITPFAGLEYTHATMDSFTEHAGATHARYTMNDAFSRLSARLGIGIRKTMGRFTPYASIAYVSDITRSTPTVTATNRSSITNKASMPGRQALKLELGTSVKLHDAWDAHAGYSVELRDHATEFHANAGVGYTF